MYDSGQSTFKMNQQLTLYGLVTVLLTWAISAADLDSPFLLFADGPEGAIFRMRPDGSNLQTLPLKAPMENPVAVTYDPQERWVYWCDLDLYAIMRAHLDGTEESVVVQLTRASSPEGITVDPVAGFLFYTDNGRDTINVVKTNGQDHRIIVDNAKHPRGIQLDTINRMVYWSDWGLGTIERTDYLGETRTVILAIQDAWINGLALDVQRRLMYWTEAQSGVVERASMDTGGGRRVILAANSTLAAGEVGSKETHFYGISLDRTHLYFTDWSRGVFRSLKNGSYIEHIGPYNFTVLNGIFSYNKNYYIYGHPSSCQVNNGGCSNLCMPRPTTVLPESRCLCPDFQRLTADQKTCDNGVHANGPDLIWLEHDNFYTGYVRGIKGQPADYLRTKEIKTWSIRSPAWQWTAIGMDYGRNSIYCVDRFDRFIIQMSLNGSLDIKVLFHGISSEVNGLAVDWVGGNIYWTDALYNWIMVAKMVEKSDIYRTIISTGLEQPHGIAVWPQKGLLIWSDWGALDKIEMARMDGEERKVLVDSGLNKPRGVTIDYKSERIFWCNEDSIESITLTGGDRQTHAGYFGNNFVDIALYKNYIYGLDEGTPGSQPQLWFYDRNLTASQQTGVKLGLNRQPYGVTMYDQGRQERLDSACPKLGCSHLCVTLGANTAKCLCKEGSKLQPDQRSCRDDTAVYAGPAYIFSMGDRICAVDHKDALTVPSDVDDFCFFHSSQYEFHALAYNYLQGEIYFTDVKYKVRSIRRAHMAQKENNTAIVQGVGVVNGITVDYISSNIYWTDSTLNQIWMSRLDGSRQKILLRNLSSPHGITLDLKQKKMYWSEQGQNPKIQTAQLDGSYARDIVSSALDTPAGLEIDYSERRLYWVDIGKDTIESVGLDDLTRRTQTLPSTATKRQIYDFALFQDYIMVSQWSSENKSGVIVIEKKSGLAANEDFLFPQHGQAFDVISFSAQNQPSYQGNYASSCAIFNGKCEHLCIQQLNNHFCVCTDGFKLGRDGSSCVPRFKPLRDNFLLIADDYRRQVFQSDVTLQDITALNFPALDRPIALDYDFREERVYWSDFNANVIKRMYINGSQVQVIRGKSNGSRVDGLAFDPLSRLLYYTDTSRHIIGAVNPSGAYHKILVSDSILNPRAIVLDPIKGYMYYTHRDTSRGRIERRWMDGTNPVVLVNTNMSWPSGLAINFTENKMYWCDSHTERIEVANLDGSERKVLTIANRNGDPFAVEQLGDTVLWTDWNIRGVFRTKKVAGTPKRIHGDFFSGLNDIKYFNRSKLPERSACSVNNGGCSHFCFPVPTGRVCACPDDTGGLQQTADDHNCAGEPTCPELIANGRMESSCSRRLGTECQYRCNSGFGSTSTAPLLCHVGMQWNVDTDRLCADRSCPILTTPAHATVNTNCPRVAAPGATCRHMCMDDYFQDGGDQIRRCLEDLTWSGSDIKCIKRTNCSPLPTPENAVVDLSTCPVGDHAPGTICYHSCKSGYLLVNGDTARVCSTQLEWSGQPIVCVLGVLPSEAITESPSRGQVIENPVYQSSSSSLSLIIGIIIAAVILVILIVVGAVFVYRRCGLKGRYRGEPNMQRLEEDRESSVNWSVRGGKAQVYDVRHDRVNLGGAAAFDNPGYGTHEEFQTMSEHGQAQALPDKQAITDEMVDVQFSDQKVDRTAFANPLFGKDNQNSNAAVENGVKVKPDLTRELSNA